MYVRTSINVQKEQGLDLVQVPYVISTRKSSEYGAKKADISETIVNVDSQMMIHKRLTMPIKIELTLEQSQQGVSNDVLEPGQYILSKIPKMIVDIEETSCDRDAMHKPFPAIRVFSKELVHCPEIHTLSIDISYEIVDIE
ncbi:hypothetical protein Tco_0604159 [Tanacetum coccineum]